MNDIVIGSLHALAAAQGENTRLLKGADRGLDGSRPHARQLTQPLNGRIAASVLRVHRISERKKHGERALADRFRVFGLINPFECIPMHNADYYTINRARREEGGGGREEKAERREERGGKVRLFGRFGRLRGGAGRVVGRRDPRRRVSV